MATLPMLDLLREFNFAGVVVRLLLALVCGGVIGYGRSKKNCAAGLWTTGIIGIALGSGFYEGGLLGTVLVLAAETSLAELGKRIRPDPQFVVEFLYDDKTSLASVLRYCKGHRMSIRNLQIHTDEKVSADYAASITLRADVNRPAFVETLEAMPGIHSVNLL